MILYRRTEYIKVILKKDNNKILLKTLAMSQEISSKQVSVKFCTRDFIVFQIISDLIRLPPLSYRL